jgi:hypothetical protein
MKTALDIAMERAQKPIPTNPDTKTIKHRDTCWEIRAPTHSIFYNPNTKVKLKHP